MSGQWEFWIDRGAPLPLSWRANRTERWPLKKLLSENPERYADDAVQGIRDAISNSGTFPDNAIKAVKMGTTVATNALLERASEPVLLMITKGFRDLLKIGYQTRPRLFDLHIIRPALLYEIVEELDERMNADGNVIRPLDETAARIALQSAYDAGLRAVAVAGLHAYRNPANEIRVAEMAREIGFSQILTSHAVSKLAKLVGRGDTTVVDAYLSPILRRYVDQVADALDLGRACEQLFHAVQRRADRCAAVSGQRCDPVRTCGRYRRQSQNRRGGRS